MTSGSPSPAVSSQGDELLYKAELRLPQPLADAFVENGLVDGGLLLVYPRMDIVSVDLTAGVVPGVSCASTIGKMSGTIRSTDTANPIVHSSHEPTSLAHSTDIRQHTIHNAACTKVSTSATTLLTRTRVLTKRGKRSGNKAVGSVRDDGCIGVTLQFNSDVPDGFSPMTGDVAPDGFTTLSALPDGSRRQRMMQFVVDSLQLCQAVLMDILQ